MDGIFTYIWLNLYGISMLGNYTNRPMDGMGTSPWAIWQVVGLILCPLSFLRFTQNSQPCRWIPFEGEFLPMFEAAVLGGKIKLR